MNALKKLEILACRTFVCPNINLIDEKGEELGLKEETIKRSREMAIEYFKKTYHQPHYSSARNVLPSIVYMAAIIEDDRRIQSDIARIFDVTSPTINKWCKDVMSVLNIKKLEKKKSIKKLRMDIIDADKELLKIESVGKALSLNEKTIDRAKNLASRFFKVADIGNDYLHIRYLRSAFIYAAGIIENDRRTQMEISII